MNKYVIGFLFDDNASHVVLIRKMRPIWQAGLWNGLGGKIEPGESNRDAMVREFQEESGVRVEDWIPLCSVHGRDYTFHVFHAYDSRAARQCRSAGDEIVGRFGLYGMDARLVPGASWMIEMARGNRVLGKIEGTYVEIA